MSEEFIGQEVFSDRDSMLEKSVVEQLIQRKVSPGGIAARAGAVLLSVISVILLLILSVFGLFFVVLFGYISYKIWQYTDVEYEYIFFEGEMQIDKVSGRKKRKNKCVFTMDQVEVVAPADSERAHSLDEQVKRTLNLSSGRRNGKRYAAVVRGTSGITKVIFEPNEKLINAVLMSKPSKVILYQD
ncbi:MAG: DUF6106 family protein [Eubacterium sp.]